MWTASIILTSGNSIWLKMVHIINFRNASMSGLKNHYKIQTKSYVINSWSHPSGQLFTLFDHSSSSTSSHHIHKKANENRQRWINFSLKSKSEASPKSNSTCWRQLNNGDFFVFTFHSHRPMQIHKFINCHQHRWMSSVNISPIFAFIQSRMLISRCLIRSERWSWKKSMLS